MLSQRRSTRLGIRYETLWQFLYQQIDGCDILACNLPVRSTTRTLGEFDLLYRNNNASSTQYIHQEMAVKFYLGKPGSEGNWFDWIGPDQRDQLGAKMEKMFEAQIALSETSDGQRVLQELVGEQAWEQELRIQGYLFYPWNHTCKTPENSHPAHLRGDWLPSHQLNEYCQSLGSEQFLIPPRQFWLALQAPFEKLKQHLPVYSFTELDKHATQQMLQTQKPVLATAELKTGQRKVFFITPDDWLAV